ncbi:MAG: hypothetical protein WBB85_08700, partial [Albidovulum sp.]
MIHLRIPVRGSLSTAGAGWFGAIAIAGLLGWAPDPAAALPDAGPLHAMCDDAATVAARREDVPLDVLRAVTRTETGRQTRS